MGGKPSLVYWDSSAFLALLIGEVSHGEDVLPALASQAGAFDRGEIILATSTVGIMEVLSGKLTDAGVEAFEGVIRRSNFITVAATETVARKAALIRRHCYVAGKEAGKPKYEVSPADAIHVASAMLIDADLIVTLDFRDKPKNKELAMTGIASFYPIPGLPAVPVQVPGAGMIGTDLLG